MHDHCRPSWTWCGYDSFEALKERAAGFLAYVKDNYPGLSVLAVGHGIINKAIQSVFYGKEMKEITPMRNAEVRKLLL